MNQISLLLVVGYLNIGVVDLLIGIRVKGDLEFDETSPPDHIGFLVIKVASNLINTREGINHHESPHKAPAV